MTAALDTAAVNAFADAWAAAMFRAAWQGALVIVLALLITRALPALPPSWRCWLWRGACGKLLLALLFTGAVAVPLLPAPQPTPVVSHADVLPVPDDALAALPTTPAPVIATPPAPRPSPSTTLFTIWSLGVLVYVALLVRDHARVARLRRNATTIVDITIDIPPLPVLRETAGVRVPPSSDPQSPILSTCADLARRLRLPHVPDVLLSPDTPSPLLVGILRPAIILPAEAGRPLSAHDDNDPNSTLRMMLAHELAHLQRRDLAWNWLPTLAHALFWFHPLVWLASRELRLAQESACDALAMSVTNLPPRAYGAMLLDAVAALRPGPRLPRAGAAAVVETRSSVQRRLAAMTHYRTAPPSRRARLAGAVVILALLAPAAVPWKLVAQSAPAQGDAGAGKTDAAKTEGAKTDPAPATPPGTPAGPTVPSRTPAGADVGAGLKGAPEGGGPLEGLPGRPADGGPVVTRYIGVVVAPTVDLGVGAGGIVSEVPVKEGDAVKKGQILLRLDGTAQEAALVEAEASCELKKVQFNSKADLRKSNDASESELREAEAELRVAEARLRAARHALSLTRVTAPFDGVLSDVAARPGMLVGNKPVATLVEISAPSVSIHVPQHLIAKLKTGQAARVFVYPLPDDTFTGKVSVISPVMQSGSGTVAVTVRLDDPEGKVRPGMQAQVQFEGI